MAETLTGEAAALYLGAMFASANDEVPLDHAEVVADAHRMQHGDRRARQRLTLGAARVQAKNTTVGATVVFTGLPRPRGRARSRRVAGARAAPKADPHLPGPPS